MKFKVHFIVALVPAILSANAYTGPSAYNCVIKATYKLSDNGTLELLGLYNGLRFAVSRKSGIVVGDVLTTELALSKEVIRFGDKRWSFEAIARFKKGGIQTLNVQEFKIGKDKPFAAFSMGGAGIVTGICR